MRKIKKGDIVGRISYGKDIFFIVEDIINLNKKEIAILKGLTIRIKADSPVEDLEILSKELIQNYEENLEKRFQERIQRCTQIYGNNKENREKEIIYTGRILHLDGDAHLSNKKKYSNTNTSEQVIFNHNKNNVSKIKIHYFFITKREENCEREHI